MASTNKTANYNLSQYIGTDKPTYLGDYNSDMSKIDAQMKTNSEATSVVAGQIETISSTATTALQNANTAQSTADSASSTATSALEKATNNEAEITDINNNLESYNTYSTEETFTGKYYIDGKRIYRKIMTFNSPARGSSAVKVADIPSDVNEIISHYATLKATASGETWSVNLPFNNGVVLVDFYIFLSPTKEIRMSNNNVVYAGKTVVLTLEYTKTTE